MVIKQESADLKAFPSKLQLSNPISKSRFDMQFLETLKQHNKITIPSWRGIHTLVHWTSQSSVKEAIAFKGFRISTIDHEYGKRCGDDAKVTLTIDGEMVVDKRPLKDCGPCEGSGFQTGDALFKAINSSGDPVGGFLPNGSIVKITLSGLKKTESKPILVEVFLDMARYATELP